MWKHPNKTFEIMLNGKFVTNHVKLIRKALCTTKNPSKLIITYFLRKIHIKHKKNIIKYKQVNMSNGKVEYIINKTPTSCYSNKAQPSKLNKDHKQCLDSHLTKQYRLIACS